MIRAYTDNDKNALLCLLRLNTPSYFAPTEEADFSRYLDCYREDYFVVVDNTQIIGSGGLNYFANKTKARISWDIIHPRFQGKGIGKKLMLHRLNYLRSYSPVKIVSVRTTQLVYPFYQKMGFSLEKIRKDFWAPGFDLYQLKRYL